MKHYSKEELDLFRNKEMSILGRINCSAHIKNCPECTKLLNELAEDDKFISDLKDSIAAYQEN